MCMNISEKPFSPSQSMIFTLLKYLSKVACGHLLNIVLLPCLYFNDRLHSLHKCLELDIYHYGLTW